MTALASLVCAVALLATASATPLEDCVATYSAQLVAAGSDLTARCAALSTFEYCAAELDGADALIQQYQNNNLDCVDVSVQRRASVSSSNEGDLKFQVGPDQDAVFHRVRRETVSIYELSQTVATLSSTVGTLQSNLESSIDSKISTVTDGLTASVNAGKDALNAVVATQTATLSQYATSTSVANSIQGVKDFVAGNYAALTDMTMAKNDITGLKDALAKLSDTNNRLDSLETAMDTKASASTVSGIDTRVSALENAPPPEVNVVAKAVTGNCDGDTLGTVRYNKDQERLEYCVHAGEWSVTSFYAKYGLHPQNPADSCKDLLDRDSSAADGVYYLKAVNGEGVRAYCSMAMGGWALVIKGANGDQKNYYGTGTSSPLQTGSPVTPENMYDRSRGDGVGEGYRVLPAYKLLVYDELAKTSVSGTIPGITSPTSLFTSIQSAGGSVSGPIGCAVVLTDINQSGGKVANINVKGLGLKCEDDSQTSWICDDDATYIAWGLATDSINHVGGINKCGSDGGDDIYNGGNTATDAYVTFWVQ